MTLFRDRVDAGRRLAERLLAYRGEDVLVVGLPRGGVPVAAEVAHELGAPLEVFVARKLGVPFHPELGMGAIAEGGGVTLDEGMVAEMGVLPEEIDEVIARERVELERRVHTYRGGRSFPDVRGRTVILVDDGIATGGTVRAAARALRQLRPRRLVIATPICAAGTARALAAEADAVETVTAPDEMWAIGAWYDDFGQTSDDEVRACLAGGAPAAPEEGLPVTIPVEGGALEGLLALPPAARGMVVFAHGSGSGRRSPRNRYVARQLCAAGLGTLLFDLLTDEEERAEAVSMALAFDVALLARRLLVVTDWLRGRREAAGLPLGYFGASTGAAAALVAAAARPELIGAVVARGGRPDLAGAALAGVRAPTLLVVGGRDRMVVELNRQALAGLGDRGHLVIVPRATHLFEEPGALEEVAALARRFFLAHLAPAAVEEARS